ncbi:MAG: 50S ribosomal protein L32 [Gammaproteobacteria bacterium]|nr:50S ribosomal protein L32 [Gammaproteobacteria bacterium]
MAVQKSRVTPSRKGMRQSHDRVKSPAISIEPASGETHRRHHISADGYDRGKKVLETRDDADSE